MKIRRVLSKATFIGLLGSSVLAGDKPRTPIIPYDAFCKSSLVLVVPFSKVRSFFQTENPKLDFFKDKTGYPVVLKLPNVSFDDDALLNKENAFSATGMEKMGAEINCAVYFAKNGKKSFKVLRIGPLSEDSQDLVDVFLSKETKNGQTLNKKKKAYKVIANFLEKASQYVNGGPGGIYWDGGPAQNLEASYMREVGQLKDDFSLKDFDDIVPSSKCENNDLITNFFGDNHGGITLELVRQLDGSIVYREWGPRRSDEVGWEIVMQNETYLKGKPGSNPKPDKPMADETNCW